MKFSLTTSTSCMRSQVKFWNVINCIFVNLIYMQKIKYQMRLQKSLGSIALSSLQAFWEKWKTISKILPMTSCSSQMSSKRISSLSDMMVAHAIVMMDPVKNQKNLRIKHFLSLNKCWLKSLTSEAIPSATQFFMRAYKISHFLGL